MKSLILTLSLVVGAQALATSKIIQPSVLRGEVCNLLKVEKDEFKGIAGIYASKQVSIIGERPFYVFPPQDPQNPKPIFPKVDTKILFTTGGEYVTPEVSLYPTIQSTEFVDLNDKPIDDIDTHQGPFFALYTHVYKEHVKDQKQETLIVKHYQHVNVDNWKSYKTVVSYQFKDLNKNNKQPTSADQLYTFKCSGFDEVNEQ